MLLDSKSQFSTQPRNTAPNDSPDAALSAEPTEHAVDDVFYPAEQESSHLTSNSEHDGAFASNDVSDVPRIRAMHNTAGYRDGVAASKETHVQDGFDEGYALGAELGSRVGWILGVLEGLTEAVPAAAAVAVEDGSPTAVSRGDVGRLLAEARAELTTQGIYGREYFLDDGIWRFEIPSAASAAAAAAVEGDEGSEVTFRAVAAAHPLIAKWTLKIAEVTAALGVDALTGPGVSLTDD